MPITRNHSLVSKEELQAFFDDFENNSTVLEGGGLSFPNFLAVNNMEEILPDAFIVKPPLQRRAAIRLFSKALYKARQDGPLTEESIISRANQIHHKDRALPLKKFTLWTKIRAKGMGETPGFRLKWRDISICTAANLPKWLQLQPFHNSSVGDVNPASPAGSGYVIVSCRERLEDDAVERMLGTLQLIMALINLYETRGIWTLLSGNYWTAGKLRAGPFHFVFKEKTFLGKNCIWYDPNYDDRAWNVQIPAFKDYLKIIPHVRKVLNNLAAHPLKGVLVTTLQLMQDAFETRDGNHRLLRFWAALEKLYVEGWAPERSNQKVIERATFADADYQLTRWQLSHIARARNEHVHARGHEDAHLDLAQTLRELLARHVLYWIFHGAHFRDHKAMLAYVDLPRDDKSLVALRAAVDQRIELNKTRSDAVR